MLMVWAGQHPPGGCRPSQAPRIDTVRTRWFCCVEEVLVVDRHPVLATVDAIGDLLKDVADVPVDFMDTADRREALLAAGQLAAQVESLRLRLLAVSGDVAAEEASRDVAAWWAHHTRADRGSSRRSQQLAGSLATRWSQLSRALAHGEVNLEQVDVIARALDRLPDDVPEQTLGLAESHLVAEAARFGPRELRILGRRVLDVVAPELGEDAERAALEAEERDARRATSLVSHRLGDGTTLLKIKVPDASADRLLTYLHAFTSPRRETPPARRERRPHASRLGQAFCSLLETLDPGRLPVHGGDATAVVVTIDLATLTDGLGVASLGSDTLITAAEARRLACTAKVLPMVLGGDSEILDLGRSRRLFSKAQRTAMAVRDRTCRARGCDIPAAWCEAHHAVTPWAAGGQTDLSDGVLLCSWHHHRAHDDHYLHNRLPNGDVRFHRRR